MKVAIEIIQKLLSGRYYLVVVVGAVFAYCAVKGTIEGKDVMIVTLLVMKDYFQRDRSTDKPSDGRSTNPEEAQA
jgi:hypothetical protein